MNYLQDLLTAILHTLLDKYFTSFSFVLTFNAFGRWAPEAPIDQTLRFRLVRASGFPSPKKKSASGFPSPKKKSGFFSVLVVFKISVFLDGFRTFVDVFARFCMFSNVFERVTDLDTVLPSLLN